MTGAARDRYRTTTAAAVLLVAGIAAVVSFLHIESLALRYGQPRLAACLLPVSIDGTVAVASLTLLRAARLGASTPHLARALLLLAVAATLGANVAYGLPHGWPGAVLSGWPAVAFVGCAEVAIGMSARRQPRPAAGQVARLQLDRPKPRPAPVNGRHPAGPLAEAAAAALAANPRMADADLAAVLGRSERTARRYRAQIRTRPLEVAAHGRD